MAIRKRKKSTPNWSSFSQNRLKTILCKKFPQSNWTLKANVRSWNFLSKRESTFNLSTCPLIMMWLAQRMNNPKCDIKNFISYHLKFHCEVIDTFYRITCPLWLALMIHSREQSPAVVQTYQGLPPTVRRTQRWTLHHNAEMFLRLLMC